MQAAGLYRRLAEGGLLPGRDISVIGILPEHRAWILSPALTAYQTDWTGIGAQLGEALMVAMARATPGPGADLAGGAVQWLAPVVLRPGASVHRPPPEASVRAPIRIRAGHAP
jgi:DNA-binding LacI/PurR family transcriptional regulator